MLYWSKPVTCCWTKHFFLFCFLSPMMNEWMFWYFLQTKNGQGLVLSRASSEYPLRVSACVTEWLCVPRAGREYPLRVSACLSIREHSGPHLSSPLWYSLQVTLSSLSRLEHQHHTLHFRSDDDQDRDTPLKTLLPTLWSLRKSTERSSILSSLAGSQRLCDNLR